MNLGWFWEDMELVWGRRVLELLMVERGLVMGLSEGAVVVD
jgi:hypothetical protein